MAQIYNGDLIKEVIAGAGIQTSKDNAPNQLAEKVVPVMETNPSMLRNYPINIMSISGAATGLAYGAYFTPLKRVFITGITFSIIKDATCDAATGSLNVLITPRGKPEVSVARISIIALTAQQETISQDFSNPIEVENLQRVNLSGTYTAGVLYRAATIRYYELDNLMK